MLESAYYTVRKFTGALTGPALFSVRALPLIKEGGMAAVTLLSVTGGFNLSRTGRGQGFPFSTRITVVLFGSSSFALRLVFFDLVLIESE